MTEWIVIIRELGSLGILIWFMYYSHLRAVRNAEQHHEVVRLLCDLIEKCIPACDDTG